MRAVHLAAFTTAAEAELVERVRATAGYRPEFSILAEVSRRVIGHALMSYARLHRAGWERPVLVLAPLAVHPDAQRAGVGTALVHECLGRAEHAGEPLVLLTGHPGYYPRFGFEPASRIGIRPPGPLPDEVFMVRRLGAFDAAYHGTVAYPRAFDAVLTDLADPPPPLPIT